MQIRRERIIIPSLAKELEGYSILHVSDIHFDDSVKHNNILWKQLHETSPDIILITGDFITHDKFIGSLCDFLEGSKAEDGIYGILGNHDYYYRTMWQHFRHRLLGKDYVPNDWRRLVESLRKLGIRTLINDHAIVKSARGAKIFLEGTDDPVLGNPQIAFPTSDYQTSQLRILMSHSPDILYSDQIGRKHFDILLSGHTHGGQIRLPRIGPLLTGTHFAKRSEAYGLFESGTGMRVNVSSGIGYSLMPVRVNCPAEVILIQLACQSG